MSEFERGEATGQIRVFPLPGLVLFPDVHQNLHIFEPRYRQMTEDALEGDQRFGMILPRDPTAEPYEDDRGAPADLHRVGCLAQIVDAQRLQDGRFHLTIQGQRRFRVHREIETDRLYRTLEVELMPDPAFSELPETLQKTLEASRRALEERMVALVAAHRPDRAPDHDTLLRDRMSRLDPIQLTYALGAALSSAPIEKQGLLELPDPLDRMHHLEGLMAFHEAEARIADPSSSVH